MSWPVTSARPGAAATAFATLLNPNRDFAVNAYWYQYSGYVSDTITLSRLTVNLGLRYDDQYGENFPISLEGSRAGKSVPPGTILPPALNVGTIDPGYRWNDWQPRVGATYSLGSDQKTLVRASYALYANQLGTASIAAFSAAPPTALAAGAGLVYPWNDLNHDQHVDPGEVDTSGEPLRVVGFNPDDPTSTSPINDVDPDFGAVKTSEVFLGIEREVLPTMAVSLGGTYRRMNNFELSSGIGLTQDDYVLSTTNYQENGRTDFPLCADVGYACGTLPDGTRYNVPVYRVTPGVDVPIGQYTRNNPGYYQSYYGLELQATKAYGNNWMARLGVAYGRTGASTTGRTDSSIPRTSRCTTADWSSRSRSDRVTSRRCTSMASGR